MHRDLKPENILCGEELEDLKIADFGLSKMVRALLQYCSVVQCSVVLTLSSSLPLSYQVLPKEKMDSACGTLSYVAPEVRTVLHCTVLYCCWCCCAPARCLSLISTVSFL